MTQYKFDVNPDSPEYHADVMRRQANDLAAALRVINEYTFLQETTYGAPAEITKWGVHELKLTNALRDRDWKTAYDTARFMSGLIQTPSTVNCGCGAILYTEANFARHFVVSYYNRNCNLLNLGECPLTAKGESITHAWQSVNQPDTKQD
jgi:hypothetical protein